MDSKLSENIERLEAQLPRWEKWLYACHSAALVMLAHAFIKAFENTTLAEALFFIEEKAGVAHSQYYYSISPHSQYYSDVYTSMMSAGRVALWLIVQLLPLACAAILAFHPTWRKIALHNRINLIFGYLLAGWVTFLSVGAQEPLSVTDGYNVAVIASLFAIGLGYWLLRRKKDMAEEVFP
ncbi:MAG: hypothetical protein HZB50_06000 [Chloroflexi bacterium]|nr:hypothetical protein [Chloroflexota bacterium]